MLYDFGPRLLKLRKDKNLTQQMVVERAKGFDPNLRLSDSVLGKYESDLAVPRLTEAAALADVLNVSLDYLTSGEKCNVLSLKELSPEQVQLLMDLTAYIRTKKRRSQGHKNAPSFKFCVYVIFFAFVTFLWRELFSADKMNSVRS